MSRLIEQPMHLSFALALSLGAFTACDVQPLGADTDGDDLPAGVQQAFADNCALSGCHSGSSPAAGLSLEPAQLGALIGGSTGSSDLPLVEIGNLYGSYLALKMLPDAVRPDEAGPVVGSTMPPGGGDPINNSIILSWIAGADVSDAVNQAPPPCYGPMETPTSVEFANHIWPIFDATCELPGCHDAGSDSPLAFPADDPAGAAALMVGVDWNTMTGMKYVDPGAPDNSYVWHKLAGTHQEVDGGQGFRMPFGTTVLCTDDILLINKWIVQGAN